MLNLHTSRRGFMQLSATSAALLTIGASTAALTGCSKVPPAEGFKTLRAGDIEFLAALAPVVLAGGYPGALGAEAQQRLMLSLDDTILTLQDYARSQFVMLLDAMQVAIARVAMGAPWSNWSQVSPEQIDAFLNEWRSSRIELKRMGYASLCKLLSMSWYKLPENFAAIGYPGMPMRIPAA